METYSELMEKVKQYEYGFIGKTQLGYDIPIVKKGEGEGGILLIGSVHGREYITTDLIFKLLDEYNLSYPIYAVPMLDIDGVKISKGEIKGRYDPLWKANYRGVDLNTNFDADWGGGQYNIHYPASENYIGAYPNSEKETQAIVNLLNSIDFSSVYAYHSKGEVVYYGFKDNTKDKANAQKVADFLGYQLLDSKNSSGGVKDYVVDKLGKFAVTLEVGNENLTHPIGREKLDEVYAPHKNSLKYYVTIAKEIEKQAKN